MNKNKLTQKQIICQSQIPNGSWSFGTLWSWVLQKYVHTITKQNWSVWHNFSQICVDKSCLKGKPYLFNRIFFASNLCYFGDLVYVLIQFHLQALAKCQWSLWHNSKAQLLGEKIPMATSHTRVTQTLDEWNEWTEVFYLGTHGLSYKLYTWQLRNSQETLFSTSI